MRVQRNVRGKFEIPMVLLVREPGPEVESREIDNPTKTHELLKQMPLDADKEHFHAVLVNARLKVIAVELVSVGTLTASLVHPREVFRKAVLLGAAGVIVAHNHTSGDVRPSAEDRTTTKRIVEAGRVLGIQLLDHVIWSGKSYYSFREDGQIG